MLIVVAAHEHPDVDDWVIEQASAEAVRNGVTLGEYRGREDVLPPPQPDHVRCHVFGTVRA